MSERIEYEKIKLNLEKQLMESRENSSINNKLNKWLSFSSTDQSATDPTKDQLSLQSISMMELPPLCIHEQIIKDEDSICKLYKRRVCFEECVECQDFREPVKEQHPVKEPEKPYEPKFACNSENPLKVNDGYQCKFKSDGGKGDCGSCGRLLVYDEDTKKWIKINESPEEIMTDIMQENPDFMEIL